MFRLDRSGGVEKFYHHGSLVRVAATLPETDRDRKGQDIAGHIQAGDLRQIPPIGLSSNTALIDPDMSRANPKSDIN